MDTFTMFYGIGFALSLVWMGYNAHIKRVEYVESGRNIPFWVEILTTLIFSAFWPLAFFASFIVGLNRKNDK